MTIIQPYFYHAEIFKSWKFNFELNQFFVLFIHSWIWISIQNILASRSAPKGFCLLDLKKSTCGVMTQSNRRSGTSSIFIYFFERDPPKNGKWQSIFFRVCASHQQRFSRAHWRKKFSLTQNQGKVHVKTLLQIAIILRVSSSATSLVVCLRIQKGKSCIL